MSDIDTGAPIPGAVVALRDARGKVLSWTRTGADGRYTIPASALEVLRLQGHRRGMVGKVFDAGANIVSAPFKFVGTAMHAGPGDIARVLITGAIGGPIAVGGLAVGRLEGAAAARVTDAVNTSVAEEGGIDVTGSYVVAPTDRSRQKDMPGGVLLSVSAPHHRDLTSEWAGAYWIDPAQCGNGPTAYLEDVQLATPASLRCSCVHPTALQISDLTVGSTLVAAGDSVPVSVKLNVPDDHPYAVRIFARSSVGGAIAELRPTSTPGVYAGNLVMPAIAKSEACTVSAVALHADPVGIALPACTAGESPDSLTLVAARLNALRPDRAFAYDPCLFAAENRLLTPITVLGRAEESPLPVETPSLAVQAPSAGSLPRVATAMPTLP